MLALPGCAYFNTFYFAKKWYSEAETVRKKSETDKLPQEAEDKYKQSIEQCKKVVRDHPRSRWADDAIYLMGACFYGKREYEQALGTFDDLLANFPDSKFAPWAHYMKGLCYYERRDYPAMETSFAETLERVPKFERKDDILFTLAQAAEKSRDRGEAVRRYRELVRQYRGSEQSDEALLHIGALYFDASDYDSAEICYDELARLTRKDKYYQEAQIRRAETLGRLGRSEDAVTLLRPLLPKDEKQSRISGEFPARVRISWARAENDLGRHDKALDLLRGAVSLYPASNYATEAQFQVGYTYEVYMDSLESAKKAYDQAAKMSAKSVFKEQAQHRLNDLNQLQELTTSVSDSSNADQENQATASLKIAELYLFSQNRVPDALAKYREVVRDFPATKVAPRAAYGVGWIRLKEMEGERDSAFVDFADLIRAYPASRQAHAALDLLIAEKADTSGLSGLLQESKPETLETPPPEPARPDSANGEPDALRSPGVSRLDAFGDSASVTPGDDEIRGRFARDPRQRDPRQGDPRQGDPRLGPMGERPGLPDSLLRGRMPVDRPPSPPAPIDSGAVRDSLKQEIIREMEGEASSDTTAAAPPDSAKGDRP